MNRLANQVFYITARNGVLETRKQKEKREHTCIEPLRKEKLGRAKEERPPSSPPEAPPEKNDGVKMST
jgi:hypothetical protein